MYEPEPRGVGEARDSARNRANRGTARRPAPRRRFGRSRAGRVVNRTWNLPTRERVVLVPLEGRANSIPANLPEIRRCVEGESRHDDFKSAASARRFREREHAADVAQRSGNPRMPATSGRIQRGRCFSRAKSKESSNAIASVGVEIAGELATGKRGD